MKNESYIVTEYLQGYIPLLDFVNENKPNEASAL